MKIVIAPDSFKESLSAVEVANAIANGVLLADPNADLICIPMADGGEGTVQVIAQHTNGQFIPTQTVNALGQAITAEWILVNQNTAIIEMATAAGLAHIPPEQRDIYTSSTYGVGLLIKAALQYPIEHLILCLGGSATNDAGIGMMAALGITFYDQHKQLIHDYSPRALARIASIDISSLDKRLQKIKVVLASDVKNPLCGKNGASHVFAAQKGASPQDIVALDSLLQRYARLVHKTLGVDTQTWAGAGAAGGLGFAALSFLKASFASGIDVIAHYTSLEAHIKHADLVITGEGCIDDQTLHGKTIAGIARYCQQYQKPLLALGGSIIGNYQALYEQGLTAAFSITNRPLPMHVSIQECAALLTTTTRDLIRFWKSAKHP